MLSSSNGVSRKYPTYLPGIVGWALAQYLQNVGLKFNGTYFRLSDVENSKNLNLVIPAKAGIQDKEEIFIQLDPGFSPG
jgi:hypothetical protein